MLIHGLVTVQDLDAAPGSARGRPLRSCLLTKKGPDGYRVSVKNSMYPNCVDYRVADLERVYSRFAAEGKMSMQFRRPRHVVLVHADDVAALAAFLRQVRDIMDGKSVAIGARRMPAGPPAKKKTGGPCDPGGTEYVAAGGRFDRRALNMRHLSRLVLEHCVVPDLPAQIGQLPIAYLSLSNSKLGQTQRGRDTLWDWMSGDAVAGTLTTLKMDSVDLLRLPFEIMYLKNLHTLSVADNKLTYLPHYIGELKKLLTLSIADNALNYLPDSLFSRTFVQLDISNNPPFASDDLTCDHIVAYSMKSVNPPNEKKTGKTLVPLLSHLSLNSILNNCVKFKRQDIPRSLWHYFNLVGRCVQCQQFILPDCAIVHHSIGLPASRCLIKNHGTDAIKWQSVQCYFKCHLPRRQS